MEEEGLANAHLRGTALHEGGAAEKRPGRQQMGVGSRGYVEGGNVGSRRGGGHGRSAERKSPKSAAKVYRILIAIVVVFFLVETIGNGLVFLRLRDADLQQTGGIMEIFPRAAIAMQAVPAGDGARFVPRVLVERLLLSKGRATVAQLRKEHRFASRRPRLALVCPNLALSPLSLYMLTLASGLQELGYNLEVHSLEDGDLRLTWEDIDVSVNLLEASENGTDVDWLNYEGVIAASLNSKHVLDSLAQEPFTKIPVIWAVTDDALGRRLAEYKAAGSTELISDWKRSFQRADVVVFPNYALPLIYTMLDTGNFFVVPGSPAEVWAGEEYKLTHSRLSLRAQHTVRSEDFVIAVVGSPFLYSGLWREHALVMRALARMDALPKGGGRIQLFIIGHGNQAGSYGAALQVMAEHVGLKKGTVHYVGAGEDVTGMLWMSDAVLYGSFRDEQAFPPILSLAMGLQRPVIVPNRSAFREQIVDGENGVLFAVGDDMELIDAIVRVLKDEYEGVIAANGQFQARNMYASNVSLSYGELLESILEFPWEADLPRPLSVAAKRVKAGWCWDIMFPASTSFQEFFQSWTKGRRREKDDVGSGIIKILEDEWHSRKIAEMAQNSTEIITNSTEIITNSTEIITNSTEIMTNSTGIVTKIVGSHTSSVDFELPSTLDLREAKAIEEDVVAEKTEREELEWRKVHVQIPLDDIAKMIRKTEVRKDELKERSDAEIQRSAQSLCIYEPYHGRGAWPFLKEENTLYRGLSLSTVDRRPGDDDVDAEVRLPGLLNDTYYRNVLCEYGAFFAIANRIDFIHKNPWIGFQPWRTSSKDVALTAEAEAALSEAASTGRDGDAVYFWVPSDNHREDFWASCDSANSGHCREAFLGSWRHMYGLTTSSAALPPMPADGGSWSAMHSWAMPTPSFVDFVLFARIFVDALDAQFYTEHHDLGRCRFSRFQREGQHCYCGLLERLVNVWAYHSAKRMIYVDPKTGSMEEQHPLESRHGKMWVTFFNRDTLKAMDKDLAQAADDSDFPKERWLWPRSGEVYWEGIFERERRERWKLKEERKQKQKEKQAFIRSRLKQQALGKVLLLPPG